MIYNLTNIEIWSINFYVSQRNNEYTSHKPILNQITHTSWKFQSAREL